MQSCRKTAGSLSTEAGEGETVGAVENVTVSEQMEGGWSKVFHHPSFLVSLSSYSLLLLPSIFYLHSPSLPLGLLAAFLSRPQLYQTGHLKSWREGKEGSVTRRLVAIESSFSFSFAFSFPRVASSPSSSLFGLGKLRMAFRL